MEGGGWRVEGGGWRSEPQVGTSVITNPCNSPQISIPDSCKCLWVAGCSPLHFHVQLTDNQEVIENIIETMYSLCPEQPLPSRFKPQGGSLLSLFTFFTLLHRIIYSYIG